MLKNFVDEAKKKPELALFGLWLLCLAVFILWLGINSLVIFVEGNRNPSLPMSTPCPVLSASMMPNQYQLEGSEGWHFRTRAKPVGGAALPADIVVENRCFNGGIGSSFLWVNNQLAAFSRIDREIYDCHGQIIWDTKYDGSIDGKTKLKVYDNSNKYLWASDIPDYRKELLIYGQPEDEVVAKISTTNTVTILKADSPAADPRLIIMLYAPADVCFASGSRSSKSKL
jgi:hypothetical protein